MSEELRKQAEEISNESESKANTVSKVGSTLVAVANEVDELKQVSYETIKNTNELLNDSLDEIKGEAVIGETLTQKLKSILNSKVSIQQAIQSRGVDMQDNPGFSVYAERIDAIQEINTGWVPNDTWWDIKSIVQDVDNKEYLYKTIQLLRDYERTTTFTGGIAYKTSDGHYYTETNVTHIWDIDKDKQCIEEGNNTYKTRWVITYHSSQDIEMTYLHRHCLYFVMDAILPTASNIGNTQDVNMPILNSFDLINGADFVNITDFSGMFAGCFSLKSIPPINTSNGVAFNQMFLACFFLKYLPQIDTNKGTSFYQMFYACHSLELIPTLDTSNGTNFNEMFYECVKITSVSFLNTSNGTDFGSIFTACVSLKSVSNLDVSKNEGDFNLMFNACFMLKNLEIRSISEELDLSTNMFISHESLLYLLNNLATVSQTLLKLGEQNLARLTEQEKEIATNKGWRLE